MRARVGNIGNGLSEKGWREKIVMGGGKKNETVGRTVPACVYVCAFTSEGEGVEGRKEGEKSFHGIFDREAYALAQQLETRNGKWKRFERRFSEIFRVLIGRY